MAYLNRFELFGYIRLEPQMSLEQNGVPYVFVSIRMVETDPNDGTLKETFLPVICYGSLAEKVVANYRTGDSVFITGKLCFQNWVQEGAAGIVRQTVYPVAYTVDRVAFGNGFVPLVTADEAEKATRRAFEAGEDPVIRSMSLANTHWATKDMPCMHYPQPRPDGSWMLPSEMNPRIVKWLERRGLKPDDLEKAKGRMMEEAEKRTGQDGDAMRLAYSFIPFSLPQRGGRVRMPDGRKADYSAYREITKRQHETLASLQPEFRCLVIAELNKRGVPALASWYDPVPGTNRLAWESFYMADGNNGGAAEPDEAASLESERRRRGRPPAQTGKRDALAELRRNTELNEAIAGGGEWYKDEDGRWRKRQE